MLLYWVRLKFKVTIKNPKGISMKKNTFFTTAAIASVLILTSCASSIQKADIPTTANPQQEITRLNTDLKEATTRNVDILASSDFKKAAKWRDEAQADMKSGQSQSEVLDDVRTSRGYLMRANDVAQGREAKVPGLFEARQAALRAGAANYPETLKDLSKIDDDVADNANDLANVKIETISKWQEGYVDLERRGVVLTNLAKPMSIVIGSKKDGAEKKAPSTYKKAQLSLQNAESVIGTSVQNPAGYATQVQQAHNDANLLNDVMTLIKQDKNLSEAAAIKLVMQNRQIAKMSAQEAAMQNKNQQLSSDLDSKNRDLSDSEANLSASESSLSESEASLRASQANLSATAESLSEAEAAVRMQAAIEKARTQFTSDEAEAYQQGKNLVIRMKKMNFETGKSVVPAASMAGLAKISEIATSLKAAEIKVEGHTDSVGGVQTNKVISEQRADAVAQYFKANGFTEVEAEGHGFNKPIASNKSKEGRAQNRRVDIVITPSMIR